MYRGRGLTIHFELRGRQLDSDMHLTPYLAFTLAWWSAAAALALEYSIPIGFVLASVGFAVAGVVMLIRGRRFLGSDDGDDTPNRSGDADR